MTTSSVTLKISGMSCASCAATIEKEVAKIEGVSSSAVNYAVESGKFEVNDKSLIDTIEKRIDELGYHASHGDEVDHDVRDKEDTKKIKSNFNLFVIAIILAVIIFLLEMGPLKGLPTPRSNWYLQLILALPIWGWIGFKFQKSLWSFIRTGRSDMNTLIGLGTTAAFLYSVFVTIFPTTSTSLGLTQRVYFEAVGFIISFVFLGQYFEDKAKRKTTQALNALFKLSAKNALVLRDGEFREISLSQVVRGDIIRVKAGEKFPVDGDITKGSSAIDEAMISGEPLPVKKSVSDKVFAGTINGDSAIEYKATKVGGDTFLAQIIQFVEDAQASKPAIQKYADRISSIFTPIVIVVAIITFTAWFFIGPEPIWGNSISNFIAVLVIACPCALGLATPTAVVVATGRASLKGLLIGGGEVIEKATDINTIVFDKTGTITVGKPTIIEALYDGDENDILTKLASIESFSEHPLAKAVIKLANDKGLTLLEPDSFEVVKGKGIIAEVDDEEFLVGNKRLLDDHQIELSTKLISHKVGSTIFVSSKQKHIATLVVGDEIKASSKDAIEHFHKLGIETWMITGDNHAVAEAVAKELGIDHVLSEALPLDKAAQVEKLQAQGKKVAMIGDGVNDAPALAKANLSLAMGTGTDVAMNASDVTIVNGDLAKACDFIELSIGTMKIIKQNLFLSMIYNTILIPVAAGVLVVFGGPMMPPVLASVAMGLSSISVVSNSLRIRKLV